jgi:competence protein ComGC
MKNSRNLPGFTIVELLVVVLAVALLLAAILPSIARAQGSSGVQQSMSNLLTLGVSHVLYALDWDGRQVTSVKDDLGVYAGDVEDYNAAVGGCAGGLPWPPECQPPILAGRDCGGSFWGWWPHHFNRAMIQPINFPGPPNGSSSVDGWGHWRGLNTRPFHDYVNGRYHDPVFYAPNDSIVVGRVAVCVEEPCEYAVDYDELYICNSGFPSYTPSPAAMFHPDVWRPNADGGWQAPWSLDHGYESPGLFQATYPNLKTHMLEHSWVQDPPADCNPVFSCWEPYWFNHGIGSSPVTLFYDGSVRLLPNTEVFTADQQVLNQTNGVDGLWHRGTPFGTDGYFISSGFDGTPLSHHVLTTEGILGRDTVSGAAPPPRVARSFAHPAQSSFQTADPPVRTIDWEALVFTPDGDQP